MKAIESGPRLGQRTSNSRNSVIRRVCPLVRSNAKRFSVRSRSEVK
jgi:hypothetical protein